MWISCLSKNSNLIFYFETFVGAPVFDAFAIIAQCYKFSVPFPNLVVAFIMAVKHGTGGREIRTEDTCIDNSPRNESWMLVLLVTQLIVNDIDYKLFLKCARHISCCHEAVSMGLQPQIWMNEDTDLMIYYTTKPTLCTVNITFNVMPSFLVQIHLAKICSCNISIKWSGGQ